MPDKIQKVSWFPSVWASRREVGECFGTCCMQTCNWEPSEVFFGSEISDRKDACERDREGPESDEECAG